MADKITLVTRVCLACGTTECTPEGKQLHFLPNKLPRQTRCPRCGMRSLVPDEAITFRIKPKLPPLDWPERPRIGRPAKSLVDAHLHALIEGLPAPS